MNKIYTRINWVNLPSHSTALDEINLNKMDSGINTLDDRIISLDTTKADATALNNLVESWTMNEQTGVITITKVDGTQTIFDLNIEKIPVSFSMNAQGVITMTTSDGTQWTANISDMIPILTFNDSDEIAVQVSGSGKDKTYSFSVKNGSITESKLQPNFLADCRQQVGYAENYANSASSSANDADYDAKLAQSYAVGNSGIREGENTDNAKYYSEQASNSATSASQSASTATSKANEASVSASSASISENNAKTSETNTKTSETNAKTSEDNASSSASSASQSALTATTKANEASASATNAKASENNAADYESGAESWYNQAQQIAEGLKGGLLPMGTITFAELPTTSTAGYMYNISNEFTTDSRFKEGAGITVSAGSNVYYTNDGYWDVMAGSPVTGVKGDNETTYRRGNVNITKDNIGLGNVGNYKAVSTVANQGLSDTEKSNARANIGAGTSNFSGSYNDLSDAPTIPTKTSDLTNDSGFLTSHQDISGKFDKTGGTISGDVRIKGSGNYGNKLNLGGGDYVYISEPSDDVMEIHGGSGIYTKDTLYFGAVSGNSKNYKVDNAGNGYFKKVYVEGSEVGGGITQSQLLDLIYPVGSIYMSVNNVSPATFLGGTWEVWGSGRVPVGVNTSDTSFDTVEETGGAKSNKYTYSSSVSGSSFKFTGDSKTLSHSGGSVGNHTLTVDEIPSHRHEFEKKAGTSGSGHGYIDSQSAASSGSQYTKNTGGGGSHSHPFTQPNSHTFTPSGSISGTASVSDYNYISTLQPYITCYMWKRTA